MNSWRWPTEIALTCPWCHKQAALRSVLSERGRQTSIMLSSTKMDTLKTNVKRRNRILQNLTETNLRPIWTETRTTSAAKSKRVNCCRRDPFNKLRFRRRNSSFLYQKATSKAKARLSVIKLLNTYHSSNQVKLKQLMKIKSILIKRSSSEWTTVKAPRILV